MSPIRRRALAVTALGVLLAVASATIAIAVAIDGSGANMDAGFAVVLIGGLWCYWLLGSVIVLRADGHRIGWLFAVSATMLAWVFGCWGASFALSTVPGNGAGQAWLTLLGSLLYPPAVILIFPAVALTFPTGSLPSPAWRWVVRLIAGLVVIGSVAVLIVPASLDGTSDPSTMNPIGAWFAGLPPAVVGLIATLAGSGTFAILIAMVAGIVGLAMRVRRARGVERTQLKWLFAAAIPAVVLIPLSLVVPDSSALGVLSIATVPLIALSVTVAVLRYRLYEIDRIISRTLGWAIVSGVLLGVFAIGVVGLQALLSSFTQGQTLAIAASTLVAFALFQPVRRRVQHAVDRRFDRARYDGTHTADAFANRVRNEVDLESVTADLRSTVQASVRPVTVGLWLRSSAL